MSDTIPPDAPCPRLCHLKKWSDFNGYGFNLHAERGKSGQFIGTIDPGSPAEFAHLRGGDRIVEVNGTNIGSENHQQVVQRIKAVSSETRLLVVDAETDEYYRDRKILIRGDMPNVEYHVTPDHNPMTHPKSDISAAMGDMKISEPDYSKYHARLCQLKIWPDFPGYGFNLHADRAGSGQYIGKVDDGSPAEGAGLREGDRIIEVNGVDIASKSHAEVVTEVKARHGEVDMLVVDRDADTYFREHGVTINGRMKGIVTTTCPTHSVNGGTSTVDKNANEDVIDSKFQEYSHQDEEEKVSENTTEGGYVHEGYVHDEEQDVPVEPIQTVSVKRESPETVHPEASISVAGDDAGYSSVETTVKTTEPTIPVAPSPVAQPRAVQPSASSASASSTASSSSTPSAAVTVVGGIEFAGSAKEARERMNKKRNVKNDMSLKEKYDLLQKL